MYKRERNSEVKDVISTDIIGLQAITGLGRNTAARIGEEAGATIRIGRRKLYNIDKVKQYLNSKTGVSND